ncbi:MAG: signal peptidase II [Candidatus Marinimicrobia bacterium]|nr:signal peptidase II [Candidatus Neomarinimicrobiota bacterium]
MKPKNKLAYFYPIFGGIALLLIDFFIKSIANRRLPFQIRVESWIPFIDFYRTYNTGYHFIFGEIGNQRLWAISGIVLVIFLIFTLYRSLIKETYDRSGFVIFSIVLSLTIGATGNVLEILFFHHATDFFIFHPFKWPSNICDQYINAIIFIMLPIIFIKSFRDKKRGIPDSTE